MSSLVLKEIGAENPADEAILELFASFREHVVHVSASDLLPDHVAVTTKNGFIELINTSNGEFRLFLTYLDHIPLDASLRCFSLVPSLYAASARHHPHLLYSLAYSNELLVADVTTGAVRLLATCVSRPSLVQCDGDYIVCGEGNGTVSVWRGSAEQRHGTVAGASRQASSLPPLLWQRSLFDDTVTCVGLHRDVAICCSADFRCLVVAVEDGGVRASLSLDYDRAVAAFAWAAPSLSPGQRALAVCLSSRVAVFAPPPLAGGSPDQWAYRGGCAVGEDEVTCASCLRGFMAVGTQSGLVLLCTCDTASLQVTEVVRFNVGYGVKGMQIFANDTLLVVTTAGDVWRWPLSDLMSSADHASAEREQSSAASKRGEGASAQYSDRDKVREEGDDEEEEEPSPQTAAPPLPFAAPGVDVAPPPPAVPPGHSVPATTTPYEVSYTQEGEVGDDRNLSAQDSSALHPTTHAWPHSATDADSSAVVDPVDLSSAAPAFENAAVTSVHLSSLHRNDDTELAVSDDDDADGHDDACNAPGKRQEEEEDSLGTDAQTATEPATALSFLSPPLAPASQPPCGKAGETTAPAGEASSSAAALYDPENSAGDGDSRDSAVLDHADGASAEASRCNSPSAVSPPSSADTTAHVESPAPRAGNNNGSSSGNGTTRSPLRRNASPLRKAESADKTSPRAGEADLQDAIRSNPTNRFSALDPNSAKTGVSATAKTTKASTQKEEGDKEMALLEAEFDHAMARMLGAKAPIEGLRRGRRMDPRKVAGVLSNLAQQHAAGHTGTPSSPALAGLNSIKLLEEHRAAVRAETFDFAAYRQAHRLEVDALQFQHPVKTLAYGLQDRVFRDVDSVARIGNGEASASGAAATVSKRAIGPSDVVDELRDVTYGRVKRVLDAEIEEERRRGGPELLQHRCEDLLYPSCGDASALLFREDVLMPSTAWEEVLLLPMPLPPASSVF